MQLSFLLPLTLALLNVNFVASAPTDSSTTTTATSTYGVDAAAYKDVKKASDYAKLNIILNNDDSWASSNIRAFYYALRTAGHKVLLVGSNANQSGKGGTVVLPSSKTLVTDGEYGATKAGQPFAGSNITDPGLNYFNGTPAATTFWAIDQVAPGFFGTEQVDLLVSGPNFGNNLGPFLYTLSGTIGASYAAVERSLPAMAFSAANSARSYTFLDVSDASQTENQIAIVSANFVTEFSSTVRAIKRSAPILPLGIGLNINYSPINSTGSCTAKDVKFVQSRLTGGAAVDKLVIGSNGLPTYQNIFDSQGINKCSSGDCSLPGETDVVASGCKSAVSVYSVDYDAPTTRTLEVRPQLAVAMHALNK